jgi:hypothetical protein
VQEPAPVIVTVDPLTAQFPPAAKFTANPDEVLALTVKGASPYVCDGSALKVIVWLACAMLNVCGTLAAAK